MCSHPSPRSAWATRLGWDRCSSRQELRASALPCRTPSFSYVSRAAGPRYASRARSCLLPPPGCVVTAGAHTHTPACLPEQGQATDIAIRAEEIRRSKNQVMELYAQHCGKPQAEIGMESSAQCPVARHLALRLRGCCGWLVSALRVDADRLCSRVYVCACGRTHTLASQRAILTEIFTCLPLPPSTLALLMRSCKSDPRQATVLRTSRGRQSREAQKAALSAACSAQACNPTRSCVLLPKGTAPGSLFRKGFLIKVPQQTPKLLHTHTHLHT